MNTEWEKWLALEDYPQNLSKSKTHEEIVPIFPSIFSIVEREKSSNKVLTWFTCKNGRKRMRRKKGGIMLRRSLVVVVKKAADGDRRKWHMTWLCNGISYFDLTCMSLLYYQPALLYALYVLYTLQFSWWWSSEKIWIRCILIHTHRVIRVVRSTE